MILTDAHPEDVLPRARTPWSGSETHVLAAALSHLLSRDEPCPARWRAASFGAAVEAARARIDAVERHRNTSSEADATVDFGEAVARLGRNPDDVAVAIRRIEVSGQRTLPAWPHLVRRGLASQPSDLDRELWFG